MRKDRTTARPAASPHLQEAQRDALRLTLLLRNRKRKEAIQLASQLHQRLARLAATVAGLLLLAGCAAPKPTLQPGDRIIFTTAARANEFRAAAGMDAPHTNRVVEVTRPAQLTFE